MSDHGGFRHSDKSKALIQQKVSEAHKRATEERGDYLTQSGKESIKTKLAERLTSDRRKKFAEDTEQARSLAEKARKNAADKFAQKYIPIIKQLQNRGMGLTEIAKHLNTEGHKSRRGGAWTDQTVRQVLKRTVAQPAVKSRDLSSELLGKPKVIQQDIKIGTPKRILGWDRKI
jgi:hypothetical protein